MSSTIEEIMQTKYNNKKEVISSMFSEIICNEIQMAYEKTVLNPVTVGADEIPLDSMRESTLVIVMYVNKESEDDYDAMIAFDLAYDDKPLVDIVTRNKTVEQQVVHIMTEDHNNDILRSKLPKTDGKQHALQRLSEYLESNNLETHCIFKLPDLTDEAIHRMAYTN